MEDFFTSESAIQLYMSRKRRIDHRIGVTGHKHKPVAEALDLLTFSPKKAAKLVKKVLQSAIANAEENNGMDIDELRVSTICVDEGMTLKRIKPRAKGRADRILKRTCHITVKVAEK